MFFDDVDQFTRVGQVGRCQAGVGGQLFAYLDLVGWQVAGAFLQIVELGPDGLLTSGRFFLSADGVGARSIERSLRLDE